MKLKPTSHFVILLNVQVQLYQKIVVKCAKHVKLENQKERNMKYILRNLLRKNQKTKYYYKKSTNQENHQYKTKINQENHQNKKTAVTKFTIVVRYVAVKNIPVRCQIHLSPFWLRYIDKK